MDKKIIVFLRRYFVVALAATIMMSAAFAVYAEYTKSEKAKRVVAAYSSTGQKFSSNYMRPVIQESDRAFRTIYLSEVEKTKIENSQSVNIETAVTLCNYVQGNPAQPYGYDIRYVLTGKLVTFDDTGTEMPYNGDLIVTVANVAIGKNDVTIAANGLLAGGRESMDTYSVTIPSEIYTASEKIYLKLEAIQNNTSDLPSKLRVYIDVAEKPLIAHSGWTLAQTDNISEQTLDKHYGYNYLLSGTGDGNVILSWDGSKIKISEIFLSNNSLSLSEVEGKSSVTIPVVSGENYDIQFYRTDNGEVTALDDISVTYVFIESVAQNNEPGDGN